MASAGTGINKLSRSPATEYYSALKREEALIHAATWRNLEDIVLSERLMSHGSVQESPDEAKP